MKGLFITFEGTEGSGKEPGGTPIGEEIRHTLKHSAANQAMTAEAELLLMNASRAQLVLEVIRPALAAGEIVLCDRFYDSTTAYQGHGRGLDLETVRRVIEFAVGDTKPDLTLLMLVSHEVSEERRLARQATLPFMRDRIEEADRSFFERVAKGYHLIAAAEPHRVRSLNAAGGVDEIRSAIWKLTKPLLNDRG